MTWIESIAVIFGLLCVWLYVRRNIWSWPAGLVQVLLYVYIFREARLYSDMILHVIYVGMQIYGWYYWARGAKDTGGLQVTRASARSMVMYAVLIALGTALVGTLMATYTDAAAPHVDAFIAVTSLIAQWMIARKVLENWLLWITVDVVAVGLYTVKELYLTAGLYAVFLGLAITGYTTWRRSMRESMAEAAA